MYIIYMILYAFAFRITSIVWSARTTCTCCALLQACTPSERCNCIRRFTTGIAIENRCKAALEAALKAEIVDPTNSHRHVQFNKPSKASSRAWRLEIFRNWRWFIEKKQWWCFDLLTLGEEDRWLQFWLPMAWRKRSKQEAKCHEVSMFIFQRFYTVQLGSAATWHQVGSCFFSKSICFLSGTISSSGIW